MSMSEDIFWYISTVRLMRFLKKLRSIPRLVCTCFSQWIPVLGMLAGRWLSPSADGILLMPDSHAPEPMLALPVWPQPIRILPSLRTSFQEAG